MTKRGPRPRPAIDRFNEKIRHADNGCIEWTASTNSTGYGTFFPGSGAVQVAHRWSYEYFKGPIPNGLHLDHLCRNRRCVNPDHLEPVTVWENHVRCSSIAVRNAEKTHCPAGHPYSGDNLYIHTKTSSRMCRKCTYLHKKARSARKERM